MLKIKKVLETKYFLYVSILTREPQRVKCCSPIILALWNNHFIHFNILSYHIVPQQGCFNPHSLKANKLYAQSVISQPFRFAPPQKKRFEKKSLSPWWLETYCGLLTETSSLSLRLGAVSKSCETPLIIHYLSDVGSDRRLPLCSWHAISVCKESNCSHTCIRI